MRRHEVKTIMRPIEEITEDLQHSDGAPPELFNELFWSAMARGLGSGVAGWGRLFADVRGWTRTGGDNAEETEQRISDADAAALVRAVIGGDDAG